MTIFVGKNWSISYTHIQERPRLLSKQQTPSMGTHDSNYSTWGRFLQRLRRTSLIYLCYWADCTSMWPQEHNLRKEGTLIDYCHCYALIVETSLRKHYFHLHFRNQVHSSQNQQLLQLRELWPLPVVATFCYCCLQYPWQLMAATYNLFISQAYDTQTHTHTHIDDTKTSHSRFYRCKVSTFISLQPVIRWYMKCWPTGTVPCGIRLGKVTTTLEDK